MIISNEALADRGDYPGMWTALLIGETNSECDEISIQITHVQPDAEQGIHNHPESQCYYLISGTGLMRINDETKVVKCGDAVFIPGNSKHGIRNIGPTEMVYLTANKAFGRRIESQVWYKTANARQKRMESSPSAARGSARYE